jgi:hypothetical protein
MVIGGGGASAPSTTSIHVTYLAVSGPFATLTPVDQFTLTRPRRDGH